MKSASLLLVISALLVSVLASMVGWEMFMRGVYCGVWREPSFWTELVQKIDHSVFGQTSHSLFEKIEKLGR